MPEENSAPPCPYCEPGSPCRFHRPKSCRRVPQKCSERWIERDPERLTSGETSDGFAMSPAPGAQAVKTRHRPAWTRDPFALAIVCRHPNRTIYARWVRVASAYFLLNRSAAQIAEDLGTTEKGVQRLVERLNERGERMLPFALELKREVQHTLRPRAQSSESGN